MAISLKERFRFTRVNSLIIVSLITSIAAAALNSIWSVYLDSFLHSEVLVGLFSTFLAVIALIAFLIFVPIIEKYEENKIYLFALIGSIISLLIFPFLKNFYIIAILAIFLIVFLVLRVEAFGIMFRNSSKLKEFGKTQGLKYSLMNFGFLIGPLIASLILKLYGFSGVFVNAAIITFIGLLIFLILIKKVKKYVYNIEINLIQHIKDFFKNKNLKKIYLSSSGINIWMGFIFVYMPLYIIRNNLDISYVGIFLSLIIVPLFFEYIIGKKSDYVGTKFFIIVGYFILAVLSFFAFFINDFRIILPLMILASFGVAFIEPTKEVYFFKAIRRYEEEKYYGIFLTHAEVGLLIGKFIPAIILIFLPFRYIFIFLALIMFLYSIYSIRLKDY